MARAYTQIKRPQKVLLKKFAETVLFLHNIKYAVFLLAFSMREDEEEDCPAVFLLAFSMGGDEEED